MKKSPPFTTVLAKITPILIVLLILMYSGGVPVASAQKKKIPAPELAGGTAWLNVSRPLTLSDLKGKMVLLDFWTYCCINCMHIIPDLKKLEAKYPKELVVIGVHAAKFTNERETENVRLPDGCQLNPQTSLVCRIDTGDGIFIEQECRELRHAPPPYCRSTSP